MIFVKYGCSKCLTVWNCAQLKISFVFWDTLYKEKKKNKSLYLKFEMESDSNYCQMIGWDWNEKDKKQTNRPSDSQGGIRKGRFAYLRIGTESVTLHLRHSRPFRKWLRIGSNFQFGSFFFFLKAIDLSI